MSAYSELNQLSLRGLKPRNLLSYLRLREWGEERRVHEGKGALYHHDGQARLLVPLDPELADYTELVGQLLSELSRLERRPPRQIYEDILTTSSDIVRVRMLEVEEDGTLELERGLSALSHARDMMLAVACSSITPRAYYPSRKFKEAEEYVEGLRLAHTEEGSFVMRILSSVPPSLQVSRLEDEDEDAPFARTVTTTLLRALEAVTSAAKAADLNGDIEPLRQAIPSGASANLFDALRGLAQSARDGGFEIGIDWSHNRPKPSNLPPRVRVPGDLAPVFEEASSIFKNRYSKKEEFELRGVVIRLSDHAIDEDERPREGEITVLGSVEGSTNRVRMNLKGEDFSRAIEAFEQRQMVRVFGDLHRKRNLYTLESPRAFGPAPEEPS